VVINWSLNMIRFRALVGCKKKENDLKKIIEKQWKMIDEQLYFLWNSPLRSFFYCCARSTRIKFEEGKQQPIIIPMLSLPMLKTSESP